MVNMVASTPHFGVSDEDSSHQQQAHTPEDDDGINMQALQDPNTEFGHLLNCAMKVKGAQTKKERAKFEADPQFLQHTLFHGEKEEVRKARDEPNFKRRFAMAQEYKKAGNIMYSKGFYMQAVEKYEMAGGIFHWVEPKDWEWRKKKKPLEDSLLIWKSFGGNKDASEEQIEQVDQFRRDCMLNIAAAQLKMKSWDMAKRTCDEVLTLYPKDVKGLYRRAQARLFCTKATLDDLEAAYQDLVCANKTDPSSAVVQQLLVRTEKERNIARKKKEKAFGGMFTADKRSLIKDEDDEVLRKYTERVNNRKEDDPLELQLKDAEMLADLYERNGKLDQARDMRMQLAQARARLSKDKPGFLEADMFDNPTQEMIEDAKKHDIDLTDPAVQLELKRLSEMKAKGLDPLKETERMEQEAEEETKRQAEQKYRNAWWWYFCFFFTFLIVYRLIYGDLGVLIWGEKKERDQWSPDEL